VDSRFEQRGAERVRVDRRVDWLVRGASEPSAATIIELSVTGARVIVPTSPVLAVGEWCDTEIDGNRGVIEVRWVQPRGRHSIIGVQFMLLSPELRCMVDRMLAEHNVGSADVFAQGESGPCR